MVHEILDDVFGLEDCADGLDPPTRPLSGRSSRASVLF